MVSSNQEVIDETANTTEDYKIRVSKAFNTVKTNNMQQIYAIISATMSKIITT